MYMYICPINSHSVAHISMLFTWSNTEAVDIKRMNK